MADSTIETIDVARIDESIQMIKSYIDDSNTAPLISLLEKFNQDSDIETFLSELRNTLDTMGSTQGAVLTYAPYLIILLSENLFRDE